MTPAEAKALWLLEKELNPGSLRVKDAWDAWVQAAHAAGRPLDGLRWDSPVESERFFARTVSGPDGHVFWTGGVSFRVNARHPDGSRKERDPRRWWWEFIHEGPLDPTWEFDQLCKEKGCIAPNHIHFRPRTRAFYKDSEIIGRLQVMAMQLGRAPNRDEWDELGGKPSHTALRKRFGTWVQVLRRAGLTPTVKQAKTTYTPGDCLAGLALIRELTGRRPIQDDLKTFADELRARGLPTSKRTYWKNLGGPWSKMKGMDE